MNSIARVYENILKEHLAKYRQMAFLSGPRQTGKTTLARMFTTDYLNWEDTRTRTLILKGGAAVAEAVELTAAKASKKIIAFDEIHRYSRWKTFLKGFFDVYEKQMKVIATGSARMNVYKRGGDSMMGRYFPYRIHPFSVAELLDQTIPDEARIIRNPKRISEGDWQALWEFGGFPEPFATREKRFLRKWQSLRFGQLMKEDVRDITKTAEVGQIEALAMILANRSGGQLVYSSLATEVMASEPTVKKWISVLKALYYGFTVKPWFENVENSIRKTPKWFLRDWAQVLDEGQRFETMVACHLLKAVEGWTDLGFGEFDLWYLRDKQKHEVDFLVSKDHAPWFIVEAKVGKEKLSDNLLRYQKQLGATHAFQVVRDLPYEDVDCFSCESAVVVPAKTLLSQLL